MTKAVFLPLSVFLLVGVPPSSTATDYCNFAGDHVLCGNKGYGPKCGDPSQTRMISVDQYTRAEILYLHNKYRSHVASGAASAYGSQYFPEAANMEELVWDTELESIAKAVSKKCSAEPSCKDCIRVDRFEVVGENIHHKLSRFPYDWKAIIDTWTYDQAAMINITSRPKKKKPGFNIKKTVHLLQVIWAQTTHIGCARVTFESGTVSVCHYGEGSNFKKNIYRIGHPCSACYMGRSCSSSYRHLCNPEERELFKTTAADPGDEAQLTTTPAGTNETRILTTTLAGTNETTILTTTPAGINETRILTTTPPDHSSGKSCSGEEMVLLLGLLGTVVFM